MRSALALLLLVACAAHAQEQAVQRALIQRDQQSSAFALQLRQSQEALQAAPANRAQLESRQLWQRQQLQNLNDKQLLEVRPDTPDALRPYERQKARPQSDTAVSD